MMSSTNDVFDSGAPEIYQIQTHASGPAGSLPLTEEMLLHSPSGDLFGLTQNAGMGWNPAEARPPTVSHPQHARRIARAGRPTHRARLSHRPLGNRPARAGGGGGISAAADDSVRRFLLRSVRWPHAGNDRHVRQPAVSQRRRDRLPAARAFAAAARRRARHRDVRQGSARDDDGGGRAARSAVRGRAGRRHAAAHRRGEDAGAVQTLGARFAHGLVSLSEAADLGCRACALARRRLSVPRHRGHGASGGRGAGTFACRTRRSRLPGSRSGWTWPAVRPARCLA